MEYLLFICADGPFTPPVDMQQTTIAWVDEMERRTIERRSTRGTGIYLFILRSAFPSSRCRIPRDG